jgi:hypothetical protein
MKREGTSEVSNCKPDCVKELILFLPLVSVVRINCSSFF